MQSSRHYISSAVVHQLDLRMASQPPDLPIKNGSPAVRKMTAPLYCKELKWRYKQHDWQERREVDEEFEYAPEPNPIR